jgi:hypothetical protein
MQSKQGYSVGSLVTFFEKKTILKKEIPYIKLLNEIDILLKNKK